MSKRTFEEMHEGDAAGGDKGEERASKKPRKTLNRTESVQNFVSSRYNTHREIKEARITAVCPNLTLATPSLLLELDSGRFFFVCFCCFFLLELSARSLAFARPSVCLPLRPVSFLK